MSGHGDTIREALNAQVLDPDWRDKKAAALAALSALEKERDEAVAEAEKQRAYKQTALDAHEAVIPHAEALQARAVAAEAERDKAWEALEAIEGDGIVTWLQCAEIARAVLAGREGAAP